MAGNAERERAAREAARSEGAEGRARAAAHQAAIEVRCGVAYVAVGFTKGARRACGHAAIKVCYGAVGGTYQMQQRRACMQLLALLPPIHALGGVGTRPSRCAMVQWAVLHQMQQRRACMQLLALLPPVHALGIIIITLSDMPALLQDLGISSRMSCHLHKLA